ncbi:MULTISPECIES: nitroreductase family protein [Gordonia]|uniref:nitroreductase family protein n=1 Tax=Gordonia TaxID=2053 RepID=UPI0002A63EF1|nr:MULTISPECIES: nitroreductase family protein [Gordonia]ATD69223.1 nitroreductase [Gordonia sp. 1D]MBA5847521.1 nitroreductase family protein [Gordonia amicalis]MDV7101536.1 nitroreductase family protein [Gordonia amicalis]MDV7172784.1 nitroreductase family protein [Gordonia amicalis]NKX77075.1 nitroreductase [Gordonia amicalis]
MHELIDGRWSARGYDPAATISVADLTTIVDAGRWAPTWGRMQPVRFLVGRRGDETFEALSGVLTRGNAGWAPRSAALVLVCTTDRPDDPKEHTYAAVDVGLAVSQMILQAEALGFNGHPMAGFDAAAATTAFDIPAGIRALVLLGIGALVEDPASLPEDIRERDERPRTRLPLDEVAFAGRWGHPAFTGLEM